MPILIAQLEPNPNHEQIATFNTDISEYNRLVDSVPQDIVAIYKQFKLIGDKYSKAVLEKTEFGKHMSSIDSTIKTEAKNQGVALTAQDSSTVPNFVEILENMPSDVLQKLCEQIFSLNKYNSISMDALKNPYPYGSPGFKNYLAFKQNNSSKVLGDGNSKVIEITPYNGSPPYIIKLTNNLGCPKLAAAHLEDKIPGLCVKTHTSIPILLSMGKIYDLIVMDAAGTDLEMFFSDIKSDTLAQRSTLALPIFKQMADILVQIQDNNLFFPDSKSSNWQLKDDKLMLADTKSIRFIKKTNVDFYPADITRTPHASPPELASPSTLLITPEQIEKAHVFIMAINMAEALTGKRINCDPVKGDLGNITDILQNIHDMDLRNFLTYCLALVPDTRPWLSDVRFFLEIKQLSCVIKSQLARIYNQADTKFTIFLTEKGPNLESLTKEELEAIQLKLNQLESNPQVKKVEELITQLEHKNNWLYRSSSQNKAAKVRQAYYNMSIDDRLSNDESKWRPVLDALGVKRGFFVSSSSFNAFKDSFNQEDQKDQKTDLNKGS